MAQKQLNILFLASWYPTRQHRTLGNFVQRHAQAVALLHRVCVVTAAEAEEASTEVLERPNLTEITVYYKKRRPVVSYHRAMKKGINMASEKCGSFDLIHVHVVYPAGILVSASKQPYLVTEHFSGYHRRSGFKWSLLSRWFTLRILNGARMIMPVSEQLGKAIRDFGASAPIQKVSNAVDSGVFLPDSKKPVRFTFLHVSTLEERSKNISGLLRGFQKLEETGVDFLLKIGGDGDIEELQRKIGLYGPSAKHVEVFGEKSLAEVAEMMRQSHAYVMFSHFENQPTTILEALSCGIPVVSSDVGGISEEITDTNGLLVPAENEAAFVAALQKMISNYASYQKEEIAKTAVAKYSYRAVAEQISKIYFSVLKKDSSYR